MYKLIIWIIYLFLSIIIFLYQNYLDSIINEENKSALQSELEEIDKKTIIFFILSIIDLILFIWVILFFIFW